MTEYHAHRPNLTRRTVAEDLLWLIEAKRAISLLAWLIGEAECILNTQSIALAFCPPIDTFSHTILERSIAWAESLLREQLCESDAFYAWTYAEIAINGLANSLAGCRGFAEREHWSTHGLRHLVGEPR